MKIIVGLPRWSQSRPCTHARLLVQSLNDQGLDASVLLTESDTSHVPEDRPDGFPEEEIPCDLLPVGRDDSWGVRWEALVRYLEERAPCFYLMLHDWRSNIVASCLSDRVFLIGLIETDHEMEYDQAGRLGHLWNAIVAVSEPLHFAIASRFPHLAPRIVTIANAVPCPASNPRKTSEGPLRIAYCGELRRNQKRLGDSLRIAQRLADLGLDFEFTFYGDGAYCSELKQQAGALVERGQVRFAGRCHNAKILKELEYQHVFLLTSEYQEVSIALLEAMSRGCVPVVSDLPGHSRLIQHGLNGFTSPVGDIDSFVDHLQVLAGDPLKRKVMSEAAFQTIVLGEYSTDTMVGKYRELFARIELMAKRKHFIRPRGQLSPPPRSVAGVNVLPVDTTQDVAYANASERWPNPPGAVSEPGSVTRQLQPQSFKPLDHRVIVAIPGGQISGVDTFATHLVRGLCQRGYDARIVGMRLLDHAQGLPLADDLVIDDLGMTDDSSWPTRWKTMREYLESLAPCFYVPNYDYDFSGIAPSLSAQVKVICIGHSDDPVHFEHCLRIGRASDAIVGVSLAISQFLAVADSTLAPRLHTIPYGIPLPALRPAHPATEDAPLRIAVVGRLVQHQKRATDIIAIARLLDERRVPFTLSAFGDGPVRTLMATEGSDLMASGRLLFPGKLANAAILKLLENFDAFLLPSSFEGLSLSLLEAMSRGVVPVVSDIRSGIPELIRHGVNGFVAPVGDVARFADLLENLYKHPAERFRMSVEAYRTIENGGYRLDDMIDRYEELFRIVASQPLARQPGRMTPPRRFSGRLWRVKTYLRSRYRKLKRARKLVATRLNWRNK